MCEGVLIHRAGPFRQLKALTMAQLAEAELSLRGDGRGTIRFGSPRPLFGLGASGGGVWIPSLDPTPQLIAIETPRAVFDRIQAVAAGTEVVAG